MLKARILKNKLFCNKKETAFPESRELEVRGVNVENREWYVKSVTCAHEAFSWLIAFIRMSNSLRLKTFKDLLLLVM